MAGGKRLVRGQGSHDVVLELELTAVEEGILQNSEPDFRHLGLMSEDLLFGPGHHIVRDTEWVNDLVRVDVEFGHRLPPGVVSENLPTGLSAQLPRCKKHRRRDDARLYY